MTKRTDAQLYEMFAVDFRSGMAGSSWCTINPKNQDAFLLSLYFDFPSYNWFFNLNGLDQARLNWTANTPTR